MSKEYFINLKKLKNKTEEIIKKKRELETFKKLIKTFYKIDLRKDINLLDAGCSDGSLVVAAKEYSINAYGIDVDTVNFESERINYPDSFFDVVICTSVIEHLFTIDNFFREIYRILKKKKFFHNCDSKLEI